MPCRVQYGDGVEGRAGVEVTYGGGKGGGGEGGEVVLHNRCVL